MIGEEVLERIRQYSGDHGLSVYLHADRALREYCQTIGFSWLQRVEGAAFSFQTGVTEYNLGSLGLRRIDAIWVRASVDGRWHFVEEMQAVNFEEAVNARVNADGAVDESIPTNFLMFGDGFPHIRVTPTPDEDFDGRIDGISETPIMQRTTELPGPAEFHDQVALLAAGYVLEEEVTQKLREGSTDPNTLQLLMSDARSRIQAATARFSRAVRDDTPNRLKSLEFTKTPLAR